MHAGYGVWQSLGRQVNEGTGSSPRSSVSPSSAKSRAAAMPPRTPVPSGPFRRVVATEDLCVGGGAPSGDKR